VRSLAATASPARDLAAHLGDGVVLADVPGTYLADQTEGRGLRGRADAVVLPRSTDEVAAALAWCYEHDVAVVPRGGGTGFAGGAVPLDGGVVLSLERLTAIRALDPLLWRAHVEAGMRTADVRRIARENGLFFPPDPGAAEQSQIGGNIATNAGGPHAFKYGVTGAWVTGLEAVIPPGDVVNIGGPIRKDVAGYDLRSLLVGSEGTLGIVTAAWLKLLPAPEAALPVAAFYADTSSGCAALERVLGNGLTVSALEYLDGPTLELAGRRFPGGVPAGAGFLVLAEADGTAEDAARLRDELLDVLGQDALSVIRPEDAAVAELWRWRDGVSIAVRAVRGEKLSEDIAVPVERLADAIEGTVEIGTRFGLEACSWGHAGDGNLHSSFLLEPGDVEMRAQADLAAQELFAMARELGGTASGEHGVGLLKAGQLSAQWAPAAVTAARAVKGALDPKGLFNPGKKEP
jgi:glycolate oxidase subunit GlcD